MKCLWCQEAMRPRNTLKSDYPGTKAIGSRGMCAACYQEARKIGSGTIGDLQERMEQELNVAVVSYWTNRRKSPLPRCAWCDVPMRKRRHDKREYPGSSLHQAKGLCTRCYQQANGGGIDVLVKTLDRAVETYWSNRKGGPLDIRTIL